jgi:hypothetical protein
LSREDKKPRAIGTTGGGKTPRSVVGSESGKHPQVRPHNREEVMARRVHWRFSDVDHDGHWSFSTMTPRDLVEVLQRLGSFESMTVREIFFTGDDPGKHYDVPSLPNPALRRLVDLGREDETKLARLRLTGERRLYGFLREHVFHVLWWDPTHNVYPSRKKHT